MPQTNDEKITQLTELLGQLITKKEWQKALVIGEYLTTLDPEDYYAYRALGFSSLKLGDLDGGEEYSLKALECGDDDVETLFMISRIHAFRGDLKGEILWLQKALERDPDYSKAAFFLAATCRTLGERDKEEELLTGIINAHPDNVPSRRALADIYLSIQKLDEAEEQLREAARYDESNSQIFADIGYILKRRNNFTDAISLYFQALELNPDNATRYYDIGDTYLALGETERAISYLRKANEMAPDNSLFSYNLGLAYFDLRRYDECEAASKTALQYDPDMKYGRTNIGLNATTNLGLAYLNRGNLVEAEQCFRKNLLLTASSYFNLGLALHRQKRYEEALRNFLHATELVSHDAEYWDLVGNAYLEMNQLNEAQKALEKSIEIDPTYSLAHYDLGVVFSRMKGRESEAIKLFKHAISLNEDGPLPYYAISCLYALQKKKKSALNFLRKSILLGFKDRDHVDNDHDWDSLRDDEEFQKIIEKMVPSKKDRFCADIEITENVSTSKSDKPQRKKVKNSSITKA